MPLFPFFSNAPPQERTSLLVVGPAYQRTPRPCLSIVDGAVHSFSSTLDENGKMDDGIDVQSAVLLGQIRVPRRHQINPGTTANANRTLAAASAAQYGEDGDPSSSDGASHLLSCAVNDLLLAEQRHVAQSGTPIDGWPATDTTATTAMQDLDETLLRRAFIRAQADAGAQLTELQSSSQAIDDDDEGDDDRLDGDVNDEKRLHQKKDKRSDSNKNMPPRTVTTVSPCSVYLAKVTRRRPSFGRRSKR
jgi:hypothetical protein